MKRVFWFLVGLAAVLLGLAGAVLPVLPTTPFMLVAVFAFARSSPTLHDWLVGHPLFGPPIRDWRREGAIGRKAKTSALAAMLLTLLVSLLLGVSTFVLVVQAVALVGAGLFIVSRPEPARQRDEAE